MSAQAIHQKHRCHELLRVICCCGKEDALVYERYNPLTDDAPEWSGSEGESESDDDDGGGYKGGAGSAAAAAMTKAAAKKREETETKKGKEKEGEKEGGGGGADESLWPDE